MRQVTVRLKKAGSPVVKFGQDAYGAQRFHSRAGKYVPDMWAFGVEILLGFLRSEYARAVGWQHVFCTKLQTGVLR